MALAVSGLIELLEDLLGQDLAELDAPLVEAVDVPDGALGEGEVLVVDDEGAQLGGADGAADEDRRRRAVAQEPLVRDQVVLGALGADVEVVGDGVVGLGRQNEVGGDELGALVDELEEGVLGVGARLAKQDGACGRRSVPLLYTHSKREYHSPVVYLTEEPSEAIDLPLDSMDSCCR